MCWHHVCLCRHFSDSAHLWLKLLFVFSLIAAKTPDAFSEKNATSLLVLGTAQKAALPTVLEDKEVFAAQCQW